MSTTEIVIRAGAYTTITPQEGVATELQQKVYVTELNQALLIAGPAGPVGPAGSTVPTLNFSYGDASPVLGVLMLTGQRLYSVRLTVDVAFNGAGPSLSVGTLASPNLFADSAVIDPTAVAVFEFSPQTLFLVDTSVYLFITPGAGATAGSGSVILQRQ